MFKNIKSWFIVDDESAVKPAEKPPVSPQPQKPAPTTINTNPPPAPSPPVAPSSGAVSEKFMDVLFQAMEANNLQGFDYLEFKKALSSLAKMPMDEAMRYQSAFTMAQTMGVTPLQLVETANHYLKALDGEGKKFEDALNNQRKNQIGNREQEIQQLQQAITAKEEQIQKLMQEIEQHRQQLDPIKQQISESVLKLENTKNDFVATYQTLVGQIKLDIENMQRYLK